MARNVALAVVDNPGGAKILSVSQSGIEGGGSVTAGMVRDFIQKDLARYPELRAKAAAIQDVVILTDERISSANYAQDMMQCYVRHMNAGGWARPGGLHIFEMHLGPATVFIAYGI